MMKGMTWSTMKHHSSLVPLFISLGVGVAGSMFYLGRLALRNPEVSWNKKGDQEPWNEYRDKQYKFISSFDYKELENKAPKY